MSHDSNTAANPPEDAFDFRGVAGQLAEKPFAANELDSVVLKRLSTERYAWLTTLGHSGMPVPMLVWFRFDGEDFTVYSQPQTYRVSHVFAHPQVSLHLESDGVGSNLIIVGGRAAVTAEGVDPREDRDYWAKYHVEAEVLGLSEAIGSYSTRITVTPTTVWTTNPT